PEVDPGSRDRATAGVEHEADERHRLAGRIAPEVGPLGRARAVEGPLGLARRGARLVAARGRGREPRSRSPGLREGAAGGARQAGGKPCMQDRAPARVPPTGHRSSPEGPDIGSPWTILT